MAKKKKSAGKRAPDVEMVILLPQDAWDDYQVILKDVNLGQDTIDSIVKSVLGSHANFNIASVKFDKKAGYNASPDVNQIPRKC